MYTSNSASKHPPQSEHRRQWVWQHRRTIAHTTEAPFINLCDVCSSLSVVLPFAVHTLITGSTNNSDCDAHCGGDLGGTFYEHLGLCECHGKQV